MSSLITAIKQAFPKLNELPQQTISIKTAAKILGLTPPISIRNIITKIHQIPDTKVFDTGYITTAYAVGGPMKVIVHSNGDYSFSGSWHNSGADNYRLGLSVSLNVPFPQSYIFFKAGDTYGTFTPGSRDLIWDDTGNDARIRDGWVQVVQADMQKYVSVTSSLEEALDSFAAYLLQVILQQAQDFISGLPIDPSDFADVILGDGSDDGTNVVVNDSSQGQ